MECKLTLIAQFNLVAGAYTLCARLHAAAALTAPSPFPRALRPLASQVAPASGLRPCLTPRPLVAPSASAAPPTAMPKPKGRRPGGAAAHAGGGKKGGKKGGKGLTPYQGPKRCFGYYKCTGRGRHWMSGARAAHP